MSLNKKAVAFLATRLVRRLAVPGLHVLGEGSASWKRLFFAGILLVT